MLVRNETLATPNFRKWPNYINGRAWNMRKTNDLCCMLLMLHVDTRKIGRSWKCCWIVFCFFAWWCRCCCLSSICVHWSGEELIDGSDWDICSEFLGWKRWSFHWRDQVFVLPKALHKWIGSFLHVQITPCFILCLQHTLIVQFQISHHLFFFFYLDFSSIYYILTNTCCKEHSAHIVFHFLKGFFLGIKHFWEIQHSF